MHRHLSQLGNGPTGNNRVSGCASQKCTCLQRINGETGGTMNKYLTVSAKVEVKGKPVKDFTKLRTVGYKLPDGRIVKPIIALEVQKKGDGNFTYLTDTEDMRKIGFDIIEYHDAEFQNVITL
jgi:hypothetical protein